MTAGLRSTVLLDACVLYPAPIRDLLLHLANAGLYAPKWTDQIHKEWVRNLLLNRPDLTAHQLQRTVDTMNAAFPDATVVTYEPLINSVNLPDPNDRHVLAAAIRGQALIIVTTNQKDFPADYSRLYDIEAQHPDGFITNLMDVNLSDVLWAFRAQVANLKKPPMTAEDVIQILRKVGLATTADRLMAAL